MFPEDWLAEAPGPAHHLGADPGRGAEGRRRRSSPKIDDWFVPESVAVSRVLDDTAIIAGDFRIDTGGPHAVRVFVRPDTGSRRIGRIVQRICEIETYKTMSMLGLARVARDRGRR